MLGLGSRVRVRVRVKVRVRVRVRVGHHMEVDARSSWYSKGPMFH